MKRWKRALCLYICLCLVGSFGGAVYAADVSDADGELAASGSGLLDSVLDALRGRKAGAVLQIPDALRDALKNSDFSGLGSDLKALFKESKDLSDEELADAVSQLGEDHGIPLVDSQIQQLCDLCRGLEKLGNDELKQKLEELIPGLTEPEAEEPAPEEPDTEAPNTEKSNGAAAAFTGFVLLLRNAVAKAADAIRGFLGRIFSKA